MWKYYYTKVFIILSLFAIIACNNQNSQLPSIFNDKIDIDLLEYNSKISEKLLAPSAFCVNDDNFIFLEPKQDKLISIYNIHNDTLTNILSHGQGPKEVIDIQEISCNPSDTILNAYDVLSKKLFLINTKDPQINKEDSIFYRIKDIISIQYAIRDDTISIYEIANRDKHFYIQTPSTNNYFGDLNFIPNVSPELISNNATGLCTIFPQNKRFAWASMFGDVFEIYDYSNTNDIKLISSIVLHISQMDDFGALLVGDTNCGVVSITSNKDYIFALYSGKPLNLLSSGFSDSAIEDLKHANTILIFDWQGNPIKQINVDKEIIFISYKNNDNTLYLLGLDENGNYKMYSLNI